MTSTNHRLPTTDYRPPITGYRIETCDPRHFILIKGARVHNLKNISVAIPRNKLVVITGMSGSGKSSLAFDTLYAEGQRRYVESLSAYARQFLGKIDKPDVDYIKGISPAIAIEQKVTVRNSRSTVGTSTEIYDYLKLLYARIGKTFSPVSGKEVKKHGVDDVMKSLQTLPEDTLVMLFAPMQRTGDKTLYEQLNVLLKQGFTRVHYKDRLWKIDDLLRQKEIIDEVTGKKKKVRDISKQTGVGDYRSITALSDSFYLLIDRFSVKKDDEENWSRITDSIQTAFYEGQGKCEISPSPALPEGKGERSLSPLPSEGDGSRLFSSLFELDGITFEEPSVHFFSFNNPVGACKTCEGYGSIIGIDEDLVVPDKRLSIYEDAVACWKGEKMSKWKERLVMKSPLFGFPIHRPFQELSKEQKELLWAGNEHFWGLNEFFRYLEKESFKIQYRVMLSRYRGKTPCPDCKGSRLRKDAEYVKVFGKSITELINLPAKNLMLFFHDIRLSEYELAVAGRILEEIRNRLNYLFDVGLGYLTLSRLSSTLSGGESQRIHLATSLGSNLVGSMYILDEPSIGLHPRDTQRLIGVLKSLKKLGNTVIVVEHDEEIMRAADELIDLGPEAGSLGGTIVFQGNHSQLLNCTTSITADYLTGRNSIPVPVRRNFWKYSIEVTGACENNLKNINVKFPLEVMTVVTGVSGSGKSSLVSQILYPALKKIFGGYSERTGLHDKITGDISRIAGVEFIDQNPIGRSSRSNPVTYIKAYDEIRMLYSGQRQSKQNGFTPAHFSFNVDGGRCEMCQGEGVITIEMQFMSDVHLPCEACKGRRFKDEVLEVVYNGKNISDVLEMTVDDAIAFFSGDEKGDNIAEPTGKKIIAKLKPLQEVGLGYVKLGQSSSTLSGGEAQRIKLASFLNLSLLQSVTSGFRRSDSPILFIFDEPTTGLHFHDIKKLLHAMNALIRMGHTILIIEHHPDVIKCADWVIDLGPEGGEEGGHLIFEGTPEELVSCEKSFTGKYQKFKK